MVYDVNTMTMITK